MTSDPNTIEIYILEIDSDFSNQLCSTLTLSQTSQIKLEGRKTDLSKKQFIASRALIALAYKQYCGNSQPQPIIIDNELIPKIQDDPTLNIALSHSNQHVAVALSKARIGLDIEQPKRDRNVAEIARHAFHESEVDCIQAAHSETEASRLFYKMWTLRESCFKMGILDHVSKPSFESLFEIEKGGYTPFYALLDNVHLSAIAPKKMGFKIIHL